MAASSPNITPIFQKERMWKRNIYCFPLRIGSPAGPQCHLQPIDPDLNKQGWLVPPTFPIRRLQALFVARSIYSWGAARRECWALGSLAGLTSWRARDMATGSPPHPGHAAAAQLIHSPDREGREPQKGNPCGRRPLPPPAGTRRLPAARAWASHESRPSIFRNSASG